MQDLSCKFFSGDFLQLLSAQIDALTKDKRGRRYNSDYKQFALSLYFSSPHSYKQLKKEFALPSVRSLQIFTQTWNILPGINMKIFDALNIKLNSVAPEKH